MNFVSRQVTKLDISCSRFGCPIQVRAGGTRRTREGRPGQADRLRGLLPLIKHLVPASHDVPNAVSGGKLRAVPPWLSVAATVAAAEPEMSPPGLVHEVYHACAYSLIPFFNRTGAKSMLYASIGADKPPQLSVIE